MTTIREFIEDWCKHEAETMIEKPSVWPTMAADPSAVEPKLNPDGTIDMEISFDYDMYRRAYVNGLEQNVTDRQMVEAVTSYLETVKRKQNILCPTPLGPVVPASVKFVGVIFRFSLSRDGRVTFYDKDDVMLTHKFRCRSRSRRLIRRAAKKHLGLHLVDVVLDIVAPINHIDMKFVIAK